VERGNKFTTPDEIK